MRKRKLARNVSAILSLLVIGFLLLTNSKNRTSSATARVLKIYDGDTYLVEWNGKKEHLRLIGIDTPESKQNRKAKRDAARSGEDISFIVDEGKRATEFVKSILKVGEQIGLEFDIQRRDRYGRLLAYVYLPDGRMLNEVIIRSGYANLMTIPPNVKYAERFRKAYKFAREHKLGLWGQ